MYLLAVSGGPDSMFLLNKYKRKKIIVAHINYGKRKDSYIDEEIVKFFCLKNNINFFVLDASKVKYKNNFQNEARKVRYDFFKKLYFKYKCTKLLIAHHRDDWLETALMQKRSNRKPFYYGIKTNIIIDDMKVNRPLIKSFWKKDIINFLNKNNIIYAIDSSNSQLIYSRNIIRQELSFLSEKEKLCLIKEIENDNKILYEKEKIIINIFLEWKENNYSIIFFNKISEKYKINILFKLIYTHFKNIKISKNKLISIKDFISGKDGGKKYILNNNKNIYKNNGFIFLENIDIK